MSANIRVLVVEDSLTIRKHMVEVLSGAEGLEVVAEAPDGKAAIELCQEHRPDVVTMDMMLPIITGVAATEYIMAYCPTPILIVSASTNRGELFKTYDALAAGAVDVLDKPVGDEFDDAWERRLISAVRLVARIRVITHPRARLGRLGAVSVARDRPTSAIRPVRVIGVGTSTGGPSALSQILRVLPVTYPLPIVVVVHISEPFGLAMAEWLDAQSGLEVRYARDGEPLPPIGRGCVLLAPPDRHLEIAGDTLRLTRDPERHSCRPSVDVLFESIARTIGARSIGCLLTGMGKDGALGLRAMKDAGARTLAQDEETSIVYGMPGEAVRIGAATDVMSLERVISTLVRLGESA